MKFAFFLSSLLYFVGPWAHAERVIVMMKDAASFQRASLPHQWSSPFPGKIEKRLDSLHTLIVDTANPAELEKLRLLPGVAYVEKEHFQPAPRTPVSDSELIHEFVTEPGQPWGLKAIKAPEAWEKSGKGEGSRVLVLDTGIDPRHPALKDNYEKGRNFVSPKEEWDVLDRTGHGTHVAGTIAAAESASGFSGVAPRAKILAGRVCADSGCSNTAVVAGIHWGIKEKVDVINLSLGSSGASPAEQAAILKAEKAGISVVAATGNYGIDQVAFPAAYPSVIAVGAVNKDLKHAVFSQYGPEVSVVAPGVQIASTIPLKTGRSSSIHIEGLPDWQGKAYLFRGSRVPQKYLTKKVVFAGEGSSEQLARLDVKDRHVLMQRGPLPYLTQIRNAMRAGATSVLIFNSEEGLSDTRLFDRENMLFAAGFFVEKSVGEALLAALAQNPELELTVKTELTDYQETFGTSMATPHVAGVVALIRSANSSLTPAEVKDIVMKTATPLSPNDDNRFGAGLVNAEAAVLRALSLSDRHE